MNKNVKRLILVVFMAVMMLFVCSGVTKAESSYPVKKLSEDKWVTHPGTGYVDYKLKVEETGYIKVSLKDVEGSSWADMYLLNSSKESIHDSCYLNSDNTSESVKWAVRAGSTYYIRVWDLTYGTGDAAKVKWTFTKVSSKSNYAKNKAITLEKDKQVRIVQTRDKFYDRWYKIKLTKKQEIKYWFQGEGSIVIYNSKLEQLNVVCDDSSTGKYYTINSQPKGTYYVRIKPNDWNLYRERANMCTFKWK